MSMTKILVIEDSEITLNIVKNILSDDGFEVIEAGEGAIGLELAQKHVPDLIICDITMPKLDGYEVLNQLRQNLLTCSIPFIFLTGRLGLVNSVRL